MALNPVRKTSCTISSNPKNKRKKPFFAWKVEGRLQLGSGTPFRSDAMDPTLFIGYYSNKTLEESKRNGETKLFSKSSTGKMKKGDIVILINTDTNCFVSAAVLAGPLQPRCLLDSDVFSGEDQKYEKSELPLKSLRHFHTGIAMEDVAILCGIPKDTKIKNNITKRTPFEYAQVFYKGEGEDSVLSLFRKLALTWV